MKVKLFFILIHFFYKLNLQQGNNRYDKIKIFKQMYIKRILKDI